MKVLTLAVGVALASAACGSSTRGGFVAMRVTDVEAHIRMANHVVHVGDRVVMLHEKCTPKGLCKEVTVGEGEVTRLMNDRDAVVMLTPGSQYQEGDKVVLRPPGQAAPR